MKSSILALAGAIAMTCVVIGCTEPTPPNAARGTAVAPTPAAPAEAIADQWLGRWTGPEGTYLDIGGGRGTYRVTIANLDGPRGFDGKADGNRLLFQRDGKDETLHATNGAATGMKWLASKNHCLTVRAGEGYCRD